MTKLEIINRFILQWFTVRIFRNTIDGKLYGGGLFIGVKPTTGWRNKFGNQSIMSGILFNHFITISISWHKH